MKKCYDIRGVCPDDQIYGNSLNPLRGDLDKIKILNPTQDDGTKIWPDSYGAGRAVDLATMPKYLERIGTKKYPLLDFYSLAKGPIVPENFMQIVEELEPGVHQFFKMQIIEENDKSLTPIGEMYWMVICNRLVTLHDTLCDPPLRSNGWPDLSYRGMVFSNQKIGNVHAWIDKRITGGAFISEELQARLVALNMSGVKFTAFDVAD